MRKRETDSKRLEIDGKVLCIDADPANHAMVASVLAVAPGVELRIAVNGQSGIRAVHTAMPDLILLNMNLPDMGGMDVVRNLPGRAVRIVAREILDAQLPDWHNEVPSLASQLKPWHNPH